MTKPRKMRLRVRPMALLGNAVKWDKTNALDGVLPVWKRASNPCGRKKTKAVARGVMRVRTSIRPIAQAATFTEAAPDKSAAITST